MNVKTAGIPARAPGRGLVSRAEVTAGLLGLLTSFCKLQGPPALSLDCTLTAKKATAEPVTGHVPHGELYTERGIPMFFNNQPGEEPNSLEERGEHVSVKWNRVGRRGTGY